MMTIQNVPMRQDEEAHSELGGKKTWSIVRFMYNIGTPQEPKKKRTLRELKKEIQCQ